MRLDLVLVKLGAVFIVVYALGNLASYVTLIFSGSQSLLLSLFLFALVFMVPALIAWVLWSFPSMSVGSLYRDSDAAPAGAGDSSHVLLIGVSLIGVYTLVFGIIDLVYFEATRIAEKNCLRMW